MLLLAQHTGAWVGTNEFRLMPTDPVQAAPATAAVSTAAAGQLTALAYTWRHPDDGAQDGLLVLGPADHADGAVAFWGDSWHQGPAPAVLTGRIDDRRVVVDYAYGGDWRWQITVDPTEPTSLHVRMDNVVPASAAPDGLAGAYPAMAMVLRRA